MPNNTTAGIQVGYIRETTEGTTPVAALKALNVTSEGIARVLGYETSNSISSTRGIKDRILTSEEAQAEFGLELSFTALKDILEMALQNTFGTALSVTATNIASTASGINAATGTPFASAQVGQIVRVSGFATAANNGYFKVATVVSGGLGLTFVNATGKTIEAAGPSVKVVGQMLRDGSVRQPATWETKLAANLFKRMVGGKINTMSMDFAVEQIATGNLSVVGLQSTEQTVTAGNGTVTAAAADKFFNAVSSFTTVLYNGAAAPFDIQAFSLSINNNLSQDKKLGSRRASDVPLRDFEVTANMTVYFQDFTLQTQNSGDLARDLTFVMADPDGNGYAITLPAFKITDIKTNAGGRGESLLTTLELGGIESGGYTVQVDAFPA